MPYTNIGIYINQYNSNTHIIQLNVWYMFDKKAHIKILKLYTVISQSLLRYTLSISNIYVWWIHKSLTLKKCKHHFLHALIIPYYLKCLQNLQSLQNYVLPALCSLKLLECHWPVGWVFLCHQYLEWILGLMGGWDIAFKFLFF